MSCQHSRWTVGPGKLRRARQHAHKLKGEKKSTEAHVTMLIEYVTERKLFGMLWHAFHLYGRRDSLTHGQLNVFLSALLYIYPHLSFFKQMRAGVHREVHRLAAKALALTEQLRTKPHQIALARMMCAQVSYALDHNPQTAKLHMDIALSLEDKVRMEEPRVEALRQLVRIVRKAGELACQDKTRFLGDGATLLDKAFRLAIGEAQTPDQADKIYEFRERLAA